jgi:sugar O-acyltransferase (sialic acid O-acetyltransferase NeuD family)
MNMRVIDGGSDSGFIDVVCWGGAGHSYVLDDALEGTAYKIEVVVDPRIEELAEPLPDVHLMENIGQVQRWLNDRSSDLPAPVFVIAIGGSKGHDRQERYEGLLDLGLRPLAVQHPSAVVGKESIFLDGTQVLMNASVGPGVVLGRVAIINTAASVDHGSFVGNFAHVAPGARVLGEVRVNDYAFIGAGAVVLPRLRIGVGAIVGAGAVVTRDVDDGVTVVGNPARPVER